MPVLTTSTRFRSPSPILEQPPYETWRDACKLPVEDVRRLLGESLAVLANDLTKNAVKRSLGGRVDGRRHHDTPWLF